MAKKKVMKKEVIAQECCAKWKKPVYMILYWTIYLTLTMAIFEKYDVVPANVPLGVIGWAVLVELPRMVIGFLISRPLFRN